MSDKKTNAMRLLDAAKIPYEIRTYNYDENDLSGSHAARVLGMDARTVFKTLVAVGDKTGPAVFVIPVDAELDLKRAAKVSGNKKVDMLHVRDLLALTGYIRGGCSPVGMKKKFPTWFDASALTCERISVSAGQRGVQMIVEPNSLIAYVRAGAQPLTADA